MENFKSIIDLWQGKEKGLNDFYINFEGERHVFYEGTCFTNSSPCWLNGEKEYSFSDNGDTREITVFNKASGLEVTEHLKMIDGCNTIRLYNTVKNKGDKARSLINFSSGVIEIPIMGDKVWYDEDRFNIYTVNSHWALEAQWRKNKLSDFGICPGRDESTAICSKYTLRSEGTWSTGRYYPIVIFEDTATGKTYFIEHEGALNWEINFGTRWGGISAEANSADINHDGFSKSLGVGEEYSTTSCLVGMVEGGFEEAIKDLTKAKRALSKTEWELPLCYNVYMGGIWGEPTDENLLPLIKTAGALGCEVFCIDAGWYRPKLDKDKYHLLGDYVPDAVRFGEKGLKGVLDSMRENGMLPGLWFEFEAVFSGMEGARGGEGMLKRNGEVISRDRGFYNLEDEKVREHLFNAVDRVYKMGMRFIKNDYNFSTGIGYGDKDYGEHNRKNIEAVYSFIDELLVRYPDLIIENCGSGGMREDNGTLSRFHVQSTSDQETYFHYPSIAAGSIALMPPEKAGIWAYPYATTVGENDDIVNDRNRAEVEAKVKERYADTNATVYNMVTGELGAMYLSGRLDLADEKNFELIKEGVDIFKKNREFIKSSFPIYPEGMTYVGKHGFYSAGLTDENKTELKLSVWKNKAKENTHTVDLSGYNTEGKTVSLVYPKDTEYSFINGKLTVTLDKAQYQAAFFEIKKRGICNGKEKLS